MMRQRISFSAAMHIYSVLGLRSIQNWKRQQKKRHVFPTMPLIRGAILALLIFPLFAGVSLAEVFANSQGHLCSREGPSKLIAMVADSDYKERHIATSFSAKHRMFFYWTVNIETGTWSVVREASTGISCITDAGEQWVRDGNEVLAILMIRKDQPALFKITINGDDWIVSIQMAPELPMIIGVDGGSQWEWLGQPSPAGFKI